MKFEELGLSDNLMEGLHTMGFEEATPIQQEAIPCILEGRDLIACAQTGTGKTAAYLLPILNKLAGKTSTSIDTLIIAPTRELAIQIDQQVQGFSYFTASTSAPVYGGGDAESFGREKTALTKGADIIIGTPGKLISHLNLGYAKLDQLKHLILDEADRMLDMGFFEDIMRIVSFLPKDRQTLLFSATMPPKIRDLAKKTLKDPNEISIAISETAEGVVQAAFSLHNDQKIPLIQYLFKDDDIPKAIIFASTKTKVKEIARTLRKKKLKVEEIHSDLDQSARLEALNLFRAEKINILVATDIISRGIDIKDIDLVINYDVPGDGEDYVHRVGRTARAASSGEAITFINPRDQSKFHKIEELIKKDIRKIPMELFGFEAGPEYKPNTGKKKRTYKRRKK
ncbi:MAG: DEAD/DEAH box helicase [Flammeovirgaceae bacterium]